MKFGVVVFPGSNCDHDAYHAIGHVLHKPVEFIWHQSEDLHQCDAVILPGGFSYGDYLRTGANHAGKRRSGGREDGFERGRGVL